MMWRIHLFYVFFMCLRFTIQSSADEFVSIKTPSGGLRGRVDEVNSRKVLKFLNVPYAKPPIDDLRLKDPVPFGKWEGERAALHFGNSCPQNMVMLTHSTFFQDVMKQAPPQSENCLSLNIYIADTISESPSKSVMLFIHGGGYMMGEGASYDGSYLALSGDVIVVTINYRLGALGFFSTDDDESPGNYGLKDQQLAFQWVQGNIEAFGGDPSSVTIFGVSAGSMSVSHHTLLASNKGLFQRAIMESGTTGIDVGLCKELRKSAVMFGIEVGCLTNETNEHTLNTKTLVQCIRGIPSGVIAKAQTTVLDNLMSESASNCFGAPTIDREFIVREPLQILKDESSPGYKFFRSVDILAGTTSMEGGMFSFVLHSVEGPMNFSAADGVPDHVLCALVGQFATMVFGNDEIAKETICEKLKDDDKFEQGRNLIRFISDAFFNVGTIKTLRHHSDGNNESSTYQYLFSYELKGDLSKRVDWIKGYGADHASELIGLFGPGGMAAVLPELGPVEEVAKVRQNMLTYWTNFAKTG